MDIKFANRASEVRRVLLNCLYKDQELSAPNEIPKDAIIVEGILATYGFHPGRIEENKPAIRQLLSGLKKEFYDGTGAGYTVLAMCFDDQLYQWGEHNNMEELCALGLATGYGKWCLPREFWAMLPGGMPYFSILFPKEETQAS